MSAARDRDVVFHRKWLGYAEPIEGLVFSVPVLADAQIAPDERKELSTAFEAQLEVDDAAKLATIRSLESFFRDFLGYAQPGMLVPRAELPAELSFYATEGQQEIRPSFALGRGPFASDELFAVFEEPSAATPTPADPNAKPWIALLWDLTETGHALDLDAPESITGPWRYPPTAKFERLLRQTGVPIGFLFNGRNLRLVYAPAGESTGHLTFRVEHLRGAEGRTLLTALDLLLHARRAYSAAAAHTLEGLLAESRRRQADVTEELAAQVFEAVEILLAGFQDAAARDCVGDHLDWLRPALEAEGDHFYQGVLSVVLRLVFLLYAEDQALLPVEHDTYVDHMSLGGLYARLSHDAGAHPESMHHRFGAYGHLLALFRAVYFGVKHGDLELPPRNGRLFDPNAFPFLEGGLPGWTAAVVDPEARANARPPSIDDGTIYRVMHRLVVFNGQRLSYRSLDVEQIGSVYESLMGYHVQRLESPAVRLGKHGVWVETAALRRMSPTDRARYLKETCGLNPGPAQSIEKAVKEAEGDAALLEAISAHAPGRRADVSRHRAETHRLVLQPGDERRRTGSHYTPRSLTEKVVKRTLEPLLACLGENRTPDQILQLKICDPAMGSGAFLVATCRELASEIVAAWTRQGELAAIIERHGDAHLHARRLVAQQCLYGVDKNPAAVELAKLSLWLVTLSRSLPFTFVDHALRHGDSLVGLDFKQIEAFHWSPPGQVETCRGLLRDALEQAVDLRQQILALAEHEDPVSQAEKRRLLEFSQQAIERVRAVADACVGAFFAEAKDAAREKERKRRLDLVERWIGAVDGEAGAELAGLAEEARGKLAPFHWWIEFPEVFFEERLDPLLGGEKSGAALMDGVVGNPPFAGKNTITQSSGEAMLDWLMAIRPDVRGRPNTDLCAYFFRRAADLLGAHGAFGLVATNTIAQGDSRLMGLRSLIDAGANIYSADTNLPWPGSAAVVVSFVHVALGLVKGRTGPAHLNGVSVPAIDSKLTAHREAAEPTRLVANEQLAYLGGKLVGNGLAVSREEYADLVRADARNGQVLRPYLGGEEVNTSPTGDFDRYVIDFTDKGLEEAQSWPVLLRIVEERVRPLRETDKRSTYRTYWWRPGESAPALYAALRGKTRCLVTAQTTKHYCVSFQPTDRFFSPKLIAFVLDGYCHFAVLQSRAKAAWTWRHASTMKTDLSYTTFCIETFPFPSRDPKAALASLEEIGRRLYEFRSAYMIDTNQGLTKTYNALKDSACDDPRVLELRRLHEEMDRAVLDAYGWSDIAVPPYCPMSDADRAAVQAFEDEVIDRLYVLNAERAAEERRLGLAGTKKAAAPADGDGGEIEAAPSPKKARKKKGDGEGQTGLF